MKKYIAIFALLLMSGCGYETIQPGYVGVSVPLYGSDKDSQNYKVVRGRYFYNPFSTSVFVFPTFMQNVVWAQDPNGADESITFNSNEGEPINVDVGLSYSLDQGKVIDIFKIQRKGIDDITKVYLRSKVRDSFVKHASDMRISDILGSQKRKLLEAVTNDLRTELGPQGYTIDMISLIGQMRVSPQVKDAIAATITAQQRAIEAENKVKQIEAEARQAVAQAQGVADATVAQAEAEAKAMLAVAQAEADSNKLVQESLTPEILEFRALEKWDGKLPTVNGGTATPFINIKPE